MDEFVKSVVEHILGTDGQTEMPQTQNTLNTQKQTIYRPNYQRNKNEAQVRITSSNVFYCVDTEPGGKPACEVVKTTDQLEEDLRWIRLQAKEV